MIPQKANLKFSSRVSVMSEGNTALFLSETNRDTRVQPHRVKNNVLLWESLVKTQNACNHLLQRTSCVTTCITRHSAIWRQPLLRIKGAFGSLNEPKWRLGHILTRWRSKFSSAWADADCNSDIQTCITHVNFVLIGWMRDSGDLQASIWSLRHTNGH